MAKFLIAMVLVFALAMPASAGIEPPAGLASSDILTVTLIIPCYTNIYWGAYSDDGDDKTMKFNSVVQDMSNNGDWWSSTLVGAYGVPDDGKASQDPWATDYYESYDAALFWIDANCNSTMTCTASGNLKNGTAELDTWYTVAFTNNVGCVSPNCGFIDAGSRDPCGAVPLDGDGCYGDDDNPVDKKMEFTLTGLADFYPLQFPFPMDDGSPTVYTADFTAFTQGTILFHARALRNGISDPGGTYTSTLTIGF